MSGVPGRPWRSQLVIVAGLVAAFVLPWLVARTFAGRRWQQTLPHLLGDRRRRGLPH